MFAIYKRELRSFFHGMMGYVLTAFLLAASGIYFLALNLGYGLTDFGYYTLYRTIFMLLLYFPVLAMRSLAEERRARTDQLLLTSPVSVWGIVAGKYLALCTVFALPCLADGVMIVVLWLLGSTVKEVAEGTFTYKVFTGIAAEHIMQKEAGSPVQPREVYIRDLTDEMLFSLVRLRDVEIAMPYGGLVNYDEYYVSGGGVNVYGKNLTKYYGTCLRDINGDHLYMLTNFGVDYRRHSLPMGSGTVTGILTREYNSNFGEMGAFQIRHLTQAEIALDPSRENSFSKVLVEWTCVKPAGFKEGVTHVAPTTGPASASLYKSNADGFYNAFLAGSGRIYFGNKPRGDVDSNGQGTANTVKGGGMYSALWDTDTYWLISNVSTSGIRSQLSLQIETNSLLATGPRDFVVEYSTDGTSWTAVPGGSYTVIGQCDSKNALPHYMPLQGLRLRPARRFAGQGVGQHSSALRQPDRNRRQVVGRAQRHEPAGPRIYQV